MFPVGNSSCGRCLSTGTSTEKMEPPEESGAGQMSEREAAPCRFHHHRGETQEGRMFPHPRALNSGSSLHGDPVCSIKSPSVTGYLKSSAVTEKTLPQESFISQVPLKLQIKVSGQRGCLGISIAGGKGSLPYKDHDEGIFISRVAEGGASEKAGVYVGDRLLEVNGLSMQGATHHEAVSALRNAGSCIKMKVFREKLLPREVRDPDVHRDSPDLTGQELRRHESGGLRSKQFQLDSAVDCLSQKIEAFVCNGNGISDLERDLNRTLSQLEAEVLKKDSLQGQKHTMAIPRIILTHPSTSDEDVELLTQTPSRELPRDAGHAGKRVYSDCSDSAFYPP
ncbi:disks large homolog 2 [Leuresthes tenuis]|uniref:disks large homolog 2 n=1 Tax=Leuresthes tenuis TaxID=355514 RepID=UPI003B501A0B